MVLLIAGCHPNASSKETAPAVTIQQLMNQQILLTNEATFTNDRILMGASAFLIRYQDSVYAVTAKHLIGPDGGVEPAVALNSLSKELLSWSMYPRVPVHPATDTVSVSAAQLNYSASNSDALLLRTVGFHTGILPLEPDFKNPTVGDTLFLVGCPYDEADCTQNLYKVVFREVVDGLLVSEIFSTVELSGFSGAPVVNRNGGVVGILMGGGDMEGKSYISATPIREIKKVNE